jgi:8-oxo-dGTP pyrophosphatase MutT (NUDIX family)
MARVRQVLRPTPQNLADALGGPSDFDLNGLIEPELLPRTYAPAAVLVPIVAHAEPSILLTERTATLSKHAGQIAFPGGTIDASDAGPLEAALREANEEIGLATDLVQPLGFLDGYRTGTGYVITPVVAIVPPGARLTLNPREVATTFEVPMAFLMDAANHKIEQRMFKGRERRYYAMPYQDRYIWGATAGILRNLYLRLFDQ